MEEIILVERGLSKLTLEHLPEGGASHTILLNLSENAITSSYLLDTFTSLEVVSLSNSIIKNIVFQQ